MKRVANYLIALAVSAFTFISCEDVPSPYGDIVKPDSGDIVVIDPAGAGTEADPYNVAGVLEFISGLGADTPSNKEVYIQGYVSETTDISAQYGNATFNMSDTEDGTANKFTVYRAKGLGGDNVTDEKFIKQGDFVVVCGKVTNYKGNTPETVQGAAYVVSVNGKGGGGGDKPVETLGTKDAPISVSKALEYINALDANGTTKEDAYVTGKITQIKTKAEDIAQYKNIDYVISDGTNELTVFRGKNIDNTDFTEAGQINIGDEVVVFGKLTKYVKDDKTTPEVAQGNYIVKLTKGSGGSSDAKGSGTESDPFNIAAAIAKCKEIGTQASTEKYYVKGIVVKGGTASGTYGNVTFDMGDTEDATDLFKAFQVAGSDGEKLAEGYTVNVGAEVIVYGPIYNYNGNTPETAGKSAAQIVTINGKKTNEGGGGTSSGATSLETNFKTNGQGDWTITEVKALPDGLKYVWAYDDRYGMKASAYANSKRYETDSWLVSPELSLANGATMTFKQALNYSTSEYVKIMYTTSNGTGDIKSSEWKEASVDTWPAGNNWTFIDSKATLPAGTVRVAFRYTSTSSTAATWEIETVSIK